jgi:hypothetical protein
MDSGMTKFPEEHRFWRRLSARVGHVAGFPLAVLAGSPVAMAP